MMKKFLILPLTLSLGMLLACNQQRGNEPAAANNTTTANDNTNAAGPNANAPTTANVSDDDKDFMNKAAQGGREEVELGTLAQKYGSSDAVKAFGKRMVDDHSAANDKLKRLAEQKGVTLNDGMTKDMEKDQAALAKKKGAAFDKEYMKMMVSDHETDVKDFQKEADNGQDPDVKSFASSTLPTLQDHLSLAKTDQTQVKSGKK